MPQQIYIGNFTGGKNTERLPFNIDNDSFPTLSNAYSWRGRVKRKRGTSFLGQLQRQMQSVATATPPAQWQVGTIMTLDGSGNGSANLISLYSLGSTASIASRSPGNSTTITLSDGTNTYTEPATPNGTLVGAPGGSGTINYSTGAITITGGAAGGTVVGAFSYYPGLPVMGLRDFVKAQTTTTALDSNSLYPVLLAFDTVYSYQVDQSQAFEVFYNVNYYKSSKKLFQWSGQDHQQFWTVNYQSALWATNNKPGFNFKELNNVLGVSVTEVSATRVTITITAHGLIVNDLIWINEVTGTIATGSGSTANQNINGQTGIVQAVVDANTITVDFTGANGTTTANFQAGATGAGGIAQYLTSSITGQDGIKWYDGDPTGGTGLPTAAPFGWVNFAPPLTALTTSIDTDTAGKYYLVGALAIVPFKDRLLFFSPFIQTSTGQPIQLTSVVIWSWNGTPYYNSLVPANETYDTTAYYVDQTGKGGWQSAGISQPIATVTPNEDVLLVGFGGNGRKTRFVYTGNDIQPFLFFTVNSELPSTSTFSSIALDRGAIDMGPYGIALTDQQSSQRIDLNIPDYVFQVKNKDFGIFRVNAIRDFFREWIYFSYPLNDSPWKFPTQTFFYNYRDDTWAIFYENYTTHGRYRPQQANTWPKIGRKFGTWEGWNEAWNSGSSSPLIADICSGNPQGYVLLIDQGTSESVSGTIQAVADDGNGMTQITSINHCVSANNPLTGDGDFLYFSQALGTTFLNGIIGKVIRVIDVNNFVVDILYTSSTYLGLGKFTRLSVPIIVTKQFPFFWDQGRKVRVGVQKYLMDRTADGQVTVNMYLSQDPDDAWNNPATSGTFNGLIYSQIMFTCPESTNIGLTPANTNLQMPTASGQFQIWHRFNTSLIGDSFQIGITLSDDQMKDLGYATSEIALHGMVFDVYPSSMLS